MSAPQDAGSAFDPEIVASLKAIAAEGKPGFLESLVMIFLKDTSAGLDQIREALRTRDARTCERAAHALKGSCGNVGAMRLSGLMEELLRRIRSGELEKAAETAAAARIEFETVGQRLRGELGL